MSQPIPHHTQVAMESIKFGRSPTWLITTRTSLVTHQAVSPTTRPWNYDVTVYDHVRLSRRRVNCTVPRGKRHGGHQEPG